MLSSSLHGNINSSYDVRRGIWHVYSMKLWNKARNNSVLQHALDLALLKSLETIMKASLFLSRLFLAAMVSGLPAILFCSAPTQAAGQQEAQEKVVYHIDDSAVAMQAMRNVENHLAASPGVRIVVVTHGKGIDFLLEDAKDRDATLYQPMVAKLKDRGVDFRVCNNTLRSRKLTKDAVIQETTIVPSGVAEVARLQAREGYVYLKP